MRKRDLSQFFKDKRVILLIILILASVISISTIGIQEGLDLKGGSLLQLQLEKPVDQDTMNVVTTVLDKRLNIYGVKDVKVRASGDQIVIVEMAGVTPEEIERLIGSPGKFEARIGNESAEPALTGSDITNVDMYEITGTSWTVPFKVSPSGAQHFAEAAEGKGGEKVYMYLDGKLIDENPPTLSPELANGKGATELTVTGGANTVEEAEAQAMAVYTVLKTGTLPVKLTVIGSNTISAELGEQFLNGAIIAGLLAILVISLIIFIRYRRPILVIPIIITSVSEVLIVMGIASIIHWNIDLSAIAGLIAAVGTGVDDQIIITDEVLGKNTDNTKRRKTRTRMSVKNALFIIFASAGTLIAAMLPLAYVGFARGSSGIGTISGFAFTTIIGVLVGIFITRPAFAKFLEIFIK
ncbi:protein translocase subunit SecD [Methanobrevibacter cuticularis]|uniref:Protein-export membrane protein SecD n=1 Tax=Methanobrevibacter cuticularis TaxID=47311 RepID=A0A166CY03_9EURY|nr:preprotein translocase subunit SecD [Methanobrevibacter cuticularis]KZX14982.1 protein translocase subunit SecD [Methanobrevibacter cuticularis]